MARHNHYNDIGFSRGRMTGMSTAKTIAAIREYGEHVLAAAKAELKKGADAVVADAKSRCPVKTGRLRDSIKAESNRDGSVYWITANASKEIKNPKRLKALQEAGIGDGRFYYGAVVEFSPAPKGKPFLYPAMEAHRQEIYDNISAAISKESRSV